MAEAKTLSITIEAPYEPAYAFAQRPENFLKWAAGLSKRLHRTERGWVAETADGEALVEFSPANPYGVLDHHVRQGGKPDVYVPLRMIANGDGVEVSLTLFRLPDMDDETFEKDADLVRRDLASLKRLLESEIAPSAPRT